MYEIVTTGSPRVCLVGTSPPRRCGIATFTDDLRRALLAGDGAASTVQVALTDAGASYDYHDGVVFEIQEEQLSDYRAAAEFVNGTDVEVVCVQHEFGIFGGPSGRHLEFFLDLVDAPVVTTLHTVLADPPDDLLHATRRVCERSDRVVVLANRAVDLLTTDYGIDPDRLAMVPHGVPGPLPMSQEEAKAKLGSTDRTLLLTFGLLGPDKGVEVVIEALPEVVAEHPEVVYLVLGATHPHVRRTSGERYRESLVERVAQLGLDEHVRFVDRYADLGELCEHLAACDLYLTPYHGTEQIVSGTLAYAVGMGRAAVSTPYPYAVEVLDDGRGALVPFGDSSAMASSIRRLLSRPAELESIQRRAAAYGRSMTWPAVAAAYRELFREVVVSHERRPQDWAPTDVPPPSFRYLRDLTDDTGVFQHARHGVPDRSHGYCTDDVARALVVAVNGWARFDDPTAATLVPTCLSFLDAAQRADGTFDNLMSFDRRFVEDTASEDTLGQAIWGLGETVGGAPHDGYRRLANELIARALPRVDELTATKAIAYALVGLRSYLERFPGALAARSTMHRLATRLSERLEERSGRSWTWFDEELTYGNAKVPEALLVTGRALENERWVAEGLASLDFLLSVTSAPERFDFVGNQRWRSRTDVGATFGQQPIEAGYTAQACMVAYELTGDTAYLDRARAALEWLLGRNRLGVPLYDRDTGRCADGLESHGASHNAGAESVVCALMGLLAVPRGGDPVATAGGATAVSSAPR